MSALQTILAGMVTVLLSMLASIALLPHSAPKVPIVLGSVSQGSEQISTTTSGFFPMPLVNNLTPFSSTTPVVGEFGSFVQVAIGTAGGSINCYDATTTSVLLRKEATSSILIASLPTNAAVGTYTVDARFYRGLICTIEPALSSVGTTTITGRW